MALKIIIDGYNLLMTSDRFRRDFIDSFEETRNRFIENLYNYKKLKGHDITVVFDGWKSGYMTEKREVIKGIKIVYSRRGEKADEVIKRMVGNGDFSTVVTSDRDVANFVSRHGAVVISSGEFEESLAMAEFSAMKGKAEEDDFEVILTTKKKGNPRRLPKSERRKQQRLKKL
ncbi:MAG: NYN domain-containing protein [Nitrospinae bacterium]|nr:NYN domain-containing protein [Nitrospinota bacterium]